MAKKSWDDVLADVQKKKSAGNSTNSSGSSSNSAKTWDDVLAGAQKKKNFDSTSMDKDKSYSNWLNDTDSFGTKLSFDANSRNNKYQDSDAFSNYSTNTKNTIDNYVIQGNDAKDYYTQNKDLYDAAYGPGATDQMLSNIQSHLDYLTGAKSSLDKESDYNGQFKDENDYNQKQAAYKVQYGEGNVDLTQAPAYVDTQNNNKTTVSYQPIMVQDDDGQTVLVPSVVKEGGIVRKLSADEAKARYQKTGEYLGKFDKPFEAAAYLGNLNSNTAQNSGENYDANPAQAQIDTLQKQIDDDQAAENEISDEINGMTYYSSDASDPNSDVNKQRVSLQTQKDTINARIEDNKKKMAGLQGDNTAMKTKQTLIPYNALMSKPDFSYFSKRGNEVSNTAPSVSVGIPDVSNIVKYVKDNYTKLVASVGSNADPVMGILKYNYLTTDETNIYDYLLAKEGKDSAQKYLDTINDELNQKESGQVAENIKPYPAVEMLQGFGTGADRFGQGMRQAFSSDELPTSEGQYLGSQVRENLKSTGPKLPDWLGGNSLGQAAYDISDMAGNLAPTIAVSAATGGLGAPAWVSELAGAGTMTLSMGGNMYKEALQQGYAPEQARSYATVSSLAMGSMQYLFGGISKLGGRITGTGINAITKNINNSLLRVTSKLGLKMVSQGSQMYLMNIMDPIIRNLTLGENNQFRVWTPEASQSFLTGALMAAVMDSGGLIKGNIDTESSGKAILKADKYNELLDNALSLDPKTQTYKLADDLRSGNTRAIASNIGELFSNYAHDGGDVSFMYTPSEELAKTESKPVESAEGTAQASNNPVGEGASQTTKYTSTPEQTEGGTVATTQKEGMSIPSREGINATDNETGEPVKVTGLSAIENGKVYVTKENGNTAALDDITIEDNKTQQLYSSAKVFDTETAKAFIGYYDGSIPVSDYLGGFASIHNAAEKGVSFKKATDNMLAEDLTPEMQKAAYYSGQNVSAHIEEAAAPAEPAIKEAPVEPIPEEENPSAKTEKPLTADNKPSEKKTGVIREYTGKTTKTQETHINAVDAFGKAIGRKIRIVDSLDVENDKGEVVKSAGNARFDPKTNEYTIALDSVGQGYMYFATHESVHDIKTNNAAGYANLERVVLEALEEDGKNIDELTQTQKELYPDADNAFLREEIVANTVPAILTDEQTGKDFADRFLSEDKDTRTLFVKFMDKIKGFLTKAYNILSEQKSWSQMKTVKENIMTLANIREAYFNGLEGREGVEPTKKVTSDNSSTPAKLSMKDVEDKAKDIFGTTDNWNEAGYITTDGSVLDFSGRNDGAPGGSRYTDHRDIIRAFPEGSDKSVNGSDSLIKFMAGGNIRLEPESPGIDISVKPNAVQRPILRKYIDRFNGEVMIDFSNEKGNLDGSVQYTRGTSSSAVIDGIDKYFDTGELPKTSDMNRFRYSLKDTSDVNVPKLEKDNDKLRDALDIAKEQIKLTQGHKVSDKAIDKLASGLLKDYHSSYDKDTFVENLHKIFDYLANSEQPSWDELSQAGVAMTKAVLEKSSTLDTYAYDNYANARSYLRDTRIKLSDAQRQEAEHAFDSYHDYRKSLFGNVNITNDGIPLEKAWQELSGKYPEMFDPDTNPGDMPQALADAVETMKPHYLNPVGYNIDEAAYDMFLQIHDDYFNLPEVKTFADKQALKFQQLKSKLHQQIFDLRESTKARYMNRMQELRADNMDRRKQILEKYNLAKSKQQTEYMDSLKNQYMRLTDKSNEKLMKQRAEFKKREYNIIQTQKEKVIRQKIRDIADDFKQRILKPKNNQYIPKELMSNVLEVAQALNFETGKKGTYGGISKTNQMLQMLKSQYSDLAKDPDYTFSKAYDPAISDAISNLSDAVGDTPIRNLDYEQLSKVHDILKNIQFSIHNAVKLVDMDTRYTNYEYGEKVINEVRKSKGASGKGLSDLVNKYNSASLAAIRFFRRLAGYAPDSQLEKLARGLDDGQLKQSQIQMEGQKIFSEFTKDKKALREFAKNISKDADWIDVGIKDFDGKSIKISPAMRISLYLDSLSDDNIRHIEGGGLTIPDEKLYRSGDREAAYNKGVIVPVSEHTVKMIADSLTEYEKRFADTAYKFFNEFTKEKINDTSMKRNGYKKATVDNYFPINSNRNFLKTDFDALVRNATIEGMGMLKSRVKGSNPVYLEDVTDVIMRQLKNVAKYGGLAIPVDNFNKVYNMSDGYSDSVKNAISQKWGSTAKDYIENLMTDLQSGRGGDHTFFDTLKTKFAQATLAANIGTAGKQLESYPAAAAVLGWGPLIKAFKYGKVDTDLVAKYTPMLWLRSQGSIDTELGDAVKVKSWGEKVPWLMNWIQKTDIAVISRMWPASEYYVQDNFPELKPGSDEYYKKTALVFNEVVEDTQPNYSIMQRPDVLRDPNKLVRSLTMFMTQRLQHYGILYDAVNEYGANISRLKLNKTDENIALVKASGSKLIRAVTSQSVAAITIALMTLASRAILHNMNPYRDDKGDLTSQSVYGQLMSDLGDSAASNFLGGNELYTVISNFIEKKNYDVVQVPNVSLINDLASATEKLYGYATESNPDADSVKKAIGDLGLTVAQFFGIPAKNITNIIQGIYLHAQDANNGEFGSFNSGVTLTASQSYTELYNDILYGNTSRVDRIRTALASDKTSPKSPEDIDVGIANILMANDPRIAEAYADRKAANTTALRSVINSIAADGFSKDVVTKAINLYETKNINYEKIYKAILSGDTQKAQTLQYSLVNDKNRPQTLDDVNKGVANILIQNDPRINEAYLAQVRLDDNKYQTIRTDIISDGFSADVVDKALSIYKDNKTQELDAPLYSNDDLFVAINNAVTSDDDTNINDIYNELLKNSKAKDPKKAIKDQVSGQFKDIYNNYLETGDNESATALAKVLKDNFDYSDDDLTNWIHGDLSDKYKDKYISAVESNDTQTADELTKSLVPFYAQKDITGWVLDDESKKMKDAITKGDVGAADEFIGDQLELGREKDSIESIVTSAAKKQVIEYYEAGDTDSINTLIGYLSSLNIRTKKGKIYYTRQKIYGWIDDYEKSKKG